MIRFSSISGATGYEIQTLSLALNLGNRAMASATFKEDVTTYLQTDCKTEGFTYTDDDRATVYSKLMADGEIAVSVRSYTGLMGFRKRNEIAEEIEGGGVILNRKFMSRPLNEIAGTLVHEFAHSKGYSHPYRQGYDWENSVPEAVGNIVSLIAGNPNLILSQAQAQAAT